MSPYEQFKRLCVRIHRVPEYVIMEYVEQGYVFIGPEYLLLGRRVEHAWFIYAAIGKGFSRFWDLMPYELPYVGWARQARGRSEVKWYPTERVKQLTNVYDKFQIAPTTST
jgi:hypothetical protein